MTVVKLGGRLLPGEHNQELVDALEELTERARRGEIIGLAWAGVTGNRNLINGWDGSGGTIFDLGAGIMALHSRYANYMMEDDE